VTIAAGFYCNDGVVLSADTQMTASPSKADESKVDSFDFPGGKVGFVFAGDVAGALCAIDKVKRTLRSTRKKDKLSVVERVLDEEYARQVFRAPDHEDRHYWLLFCLWLPGEKAKLYGTSSVSVYPVYSWDAIGIGADLAKFIVQQGSPPARIREALKLSSYALRSIKDNVEGCGGMSVHLVFTNDGRSGVVTSAYYGPSKELQEYARAYDLTCRELLMQIANEGATNEHCKQYIDTVLTPRLLGKRDQWIADRQRREDDLLSRNKWMTQDQAHRTTLDLDVGLLPDAQHTKPLRKRAQ
jgi:20S proteasome alpha/beta subunit